MADGLRALGFPVDTTADEVWTVRPARCADRPGWTVGLAGTIMRFAPPVAALADGNGHLRRRPARAQPAAAPDRRGAAPLGVRIDASPTGGLPLTVHGTGRSTAARRSSTRPGPASSSRAAAVRAALRQGAGAAARGPAGAVRAAPADDHAHAAGRRRVGGRERAGRLGGRAGRLRGRAWDIEPDLSGAAPFFAAAMVTGGAVTLAGWPRDSWQPVGRLPSCSPRWAPR
jgi:3-phosphoshikimate 1-carboxyvinyltransferase